MTPPSNPRPAVQSPPPALARFPQQPSWAPNQQPKTPEEQRRGLNTGIIAATVLAVVLGLITFFFCLLALGLGWFWSFLIADAVLVIVRGFQSWAHKRMALREWIPDYGEGSVRNLETYRFIFWRRVFRLSVWTGLLLAGAMLGTLILSMLPSSVGGVLGLVLLLIFQVGFIFIAQFLIFFGPFVLYGAIGREVVQPGDANFQVRMDDVRGQKSAVKEMKSILQLLEQGRNFVKAGGKRERGVLMVGPPGTGKTMLAKAIASHLDVPIIVTSGAAFAGMFMGMDVLNVFMLVRKAKKLAKVWGGCVIFIDEFDAIGSRRSGMGGGGGMMGGMFMGNGMMGLNMLLVLMDGIDRAGFVKKNLRRLVNILLDGLYFPRTIGFNGNRLPLRIPNLRPPNYNMLFVGATNRPQVLDEAITRPGRFGRQIVFRLPTRDGRKDVADLYFSRKRHDPELDSPARREEFARVTHNYSPAEIEQSLSVALMYAFENGRDYFTWQDLREAMSNIEGGLAYPVEYTERDKLAIARHELGHAVAASFYRPDYAHGRLSLKARTSGTLAFHRGVPIEEEFIEFRSQFAGEVRWVLGALATERVFYGENSGGVYGDLQMAAKIACHMVGEVGMGPDALSQEMSRKAIAFGESLISVAEVKQGMQEQGTTVGAVLVNPVARRTVAQVLGSAYIDCWRLAYVNREAIDQAAEVLMIQEEMVGDEIKGLLDSVGLRLPNDADPYPEELPKLPQIEEPERTRPAAMDRSA